MRNPNLFFLWPPKNGDTGADVYGRSSLKSLPPNSILIAEHTPYTPLAYLQTVEGIRPDVHILQIRPGGDIADAIKRLPSNTDIFLADNNPEYYNLSKLPNATVEPFGLIYRLVLSPSS